MRYLKTRARADRKQFKQKHHNKRSARLDKQRTRSFAQYVAALHNYAQEHPEDKQVLAKAKEAEQVLKHRPNHKAGVYTFV